VLQRRIRRTLLGLAVLAAALALAGCDLPLPPTPTATTIPRLLLTVTPTARPATATPIPPTATSTRQPTASRTATPTPARVVRYVSADGDGVFIRSKPDLDAKVKVWPDGTALELLVEDGAWSQVRDPDGYVGYMPTRYLSATPMGPTATPTWQPAAATIMFVVAGGDGVFIRSRPDREARVKVWPDGTKVTVLGREGEWCYVRDPDGYLGFMPAEYLAATWP
jgi:SH3-like domain-containing protein